MRKKLWVAPAVKRGVKIESERAIAATNNSTPITMDRILIFDSNCISKLNLLLKYSPFDFRHLLSFIKQKIAKRFHLFVL
ncbi:hypothetical protein HMPREF9554_01012 [Treponema phagedenis F0421]|nr:hypothetical protein HMPREF9554_01012 [Treponema phagedenis F0421]